MIPRHVIYLDSQDVENYITNGKLNHLYEQLANIGELIGQAEKDILRDIMEEKNTFESGTTPGPESSGQSHRTQKATTEILNQLLRKAGMGADGRDYNLTDAAAIIHYLTGYSYNTIRHYLSSGELSRAQSDEIQDRAVSTLIDNGILIVDEDDNIRFKSIELVTILYDLYRNGTCIYWQYPPTSHVIMDSLVESELLTFQNTLLTNEEADYLSYLLKNDVFTNGPAIRNNYAHDQYDGPADSNTLTGHYTHLLLIIILLLFKIESDLLIEKKLREAGYNEEIVRSDLS